MIKTQKERIDKGRQAFNDEIIRCSESDNIYEAILEWEFTCEVDCYSHECDYDIITIKEKLLDAGRPDMAYKVNINFKGYGGCGSCICGQHNLRYVFYIQNKINKTVLHTGSDCIFKVFPDGQVFNDILLLDKILKSSKRSVKKIREENKSLKAENKVLVQRNAELILENKKLKSKIDDINTDNLKKKIKSLEQNNIRLEGILSIYKNINGSEMNKECDKFFENVEKIKITDNYYGKIKQ